MLFKRKNRNFNITAERAKQNCEEYRNSLKNILRDWINKWNKEIEQASNKGKVFIITNRFIVNKENKDEVLWLVNDANCTIDVPNKFIYLSNLIRYYENLGFEVVLQDYQVAGFMALKISWKSEKEKEYEETYLCN